MIEISFLSPGRVELMLTKKQEARDELIYEIELKGIDRVLDELLEVLDTEYSDLSNFSDERIDAGVANAFDIDNSFSDAITEAIIITQEPEWLECSENVTKLETVFRRFEKLENDIIDEAVDRKRLVLP